MKLSPDLNIWVKNAGLLTAKKSAVSCAIIIVYEHGKKNLSLYWLP
jgi:hypothetical protein